MPEGSPQESTSAADPPAVDQAVAAMNSRFVVTSDRGTLRYLDNGEVSADALQIPGVMNTAERSTRSSRRDRRSVARRWLSSPMAIFALLVVVLIMFALLSLI